jgi:PIN domain nuclease of toxin-antitoxin system
VSAASIWEIAIKLGLGKLAVSPVDLAAAIDSGGFRPLVVTSQHVWKVLELPSYPDHRDPFDRLLIAQALVEGLTIVTRDPHFERYPVNRLRA